MVGACFIAGTAQLLQPCHIHHIHHIPQTDRQTGLGPSRGRGGGAGEAVWFEVGLVGYGCVLFVCMCAKISYYNIIRLPHPSSGAATSRFKPLSLFTINPSCAHPPQQQHALRTHANMSTHTHSHGVCSHKHADSVRFRLKAAQTNTRRSC